MPLPITWSYNNILAILSKSTLKNICVVSAHGWDKYGHFLGDFKSLVKFVHF